MTIEDTKRFHFLDALRGVAAINVMLMHLGAHSGYVFMPLAYFSVDLFFVLSGFVIAKRYEHPLTNGMRSSTFIKHRFVRLYPMHLIGTVVGGTGLLYAVAANLTEMSKLQLSLSLVLNAFFIPYFNYCTYPVFGDLTERGLIFPANTPAWSLFFEVLVNFAFIVTAGWRTRVHGALIVLAFFALGCVDKRDSQISRGLIQGFFFGGGSLGLSERCERRCVGDH